MTKAGAKTSRHWGPLIDWLQARIRARIVPLDQVAAAVPSRGLVLELGCGQGLVLELLADRVERAIGVDYDERKCHLARAALSRHPHVEIVCADIVSFLRDFSGVAECVIISDTLSSFPKHLQDEVLALAVQALSKGGTLVLKFIDTTPRWKMLISYLLSTAVYQGLHLSLSEGQEFRYRSRHDYAEVLGRLGVATSTRVLHRWWEPIPHVMLIGSKP